MEVILFASPYRTIEILIFCVHFCVEELSIHVARQKWGSFFPYKKASGSENSEVPADFLETYVWH